MLEFQAGNALTFGAKMDFAKLRTCNNVNIIWRLRLDKLGLNQNTFRFFVCQTPLPTIVALSALGAARLHSEPSESAISTKLVPVRPVAVAAGGISLKPDEALQIMWKPIMIVIGREQLEALGIWY